MSDEKKDSCSKCKFFSNGLTKNGYCKLYRHNISEPDRICSKYEKKEIGISKANKTEADFYSKPMDNKAVGKMQYEKTLSYIIGLISFFVIIIAVLFCIIVFFSEFFSHPIPVPVQIGTLAVVAAAYIILLWHTLMLLRKYRFIYIFYLIIAVVMIVAAVLDFGKLWISLDDIDKIIIDYVFFNIGK